MMSATACWRNVCYLRRAAGGPPGQRRRPDPGLFRGEERDHTYLFIVFVYIVGQFASHPRRTGGSCIEQRQYLQLRSHDNGPVAARTGKDMPELEGAILAVQGRGDSHGRGGDSLGALPGWDGWRTSPRLSPHYPGFPHAQPRVRRQASAMTRAPTTSNPIRCLGYASIW